MKKTNKKVGKKSKAKDEVIDLKLTDKEIIDISLEASRRGIPFKSMLYLVIREGIYFSKYNENMIDDGK
jgi:predicted DNA binding CopG/RHH family protein